VSTRSTTYEDEADVPLASVALAASRWSPSSIENVRDHAPVEDAVVVPRDTESAKSSTVEFAAAVPKATTVPDDVQL
jgi:hypothetical protein